MWEAVPGRQTWLTRAWCTKLSGWRAGGALELCSSARADSAAARAIARLLTSKIFCQQLRCFCLQPSSHLHFSIYIISLETGVQIALWSGQNYFTQHVLNHGSEDVSTVSGFHFSLNKEESSFFSLSSYCHNLLLQARITWSSALHAMRLRGGVWSQGQMSSEGTAGWHWTVAATKMLMLMSLQGHQLPPMPWKRDYTSGAPEFCLMPCDASVLLAWAWPGLMDSLRHPEVFLLFPWHYRFLRVFTVFPSPSHYVCTCV